MDDRNDSYGTNGWEPGENHENTAENTGASAPGNGGPDDRFSANGGSQSFNNWQSYSGNPNPGAAGPGQAAGGTAQALGLHGRRRRRKRERL